MTGVPGVSGVIRSLSEPVLLIDPDGRVLDANPPAVRMLGPDVGGPDALLSDLLAAAPEDVAAFVSRAGASTSPTFAGFAARAARLGYLRLEGVRVMAPSAEPALVMVRCRERTAAASRFVELNDRVDLLSRALVESRRLEYELRGVTDELRERLEQLRRAEAASRRRAAETRRLAAEQSALRQVAMLAAADTPPAAVFAAVAREAARVVDADLGAVVRFDDEDEGAGRVVGIWTNGVLRVPVRDLTVPLAGTGLSARVRRSGETVDIPDYAEVDPETRRKVPHGLSTGVAAPVIVDSGVWGAIVVARGRLRPFSAVARQRMERFADTTSVAVASAQNRERLAMLASTDDLTGLLNRRAFQERVAAEFERALRHGRPVSLVVVDIDHFTLVNDTHGHGVGDRVLVDVARRLVALARPGEVVARIGGEEFAVLLPECDGDEGFAVAERVRAAINAVAFPGVGRLTSSAGLCDAAEARRPADLLRLADVALYWAKHQGRNRSFRYSQSALELLSAEEQDRRLTRARTLASITALAVAVDAKDSYTQRHSERVADLAVRLAEVLGWDRERIALLHQAALVHDVGKIGVRDAVLLKEGPLTDVEYAEVKEHAALGARMLVDALTPEQVMWVRHHHERWSGGGYPDGLVGPETSEGARILALADAWDAMTTARPYGTPRTVPDAVDECRRSSGTQFCPVVVSALVGLFEDGALELDPGDGERSRSGWAR